MHLWSAITPNFTPVVTLDLLLPLLDKFRKESHVSVLHNTLLFLLWRCDPTWVMASSFLRFLDHTQRRPTVGRTPLDEWSARRRDLYLTTHNTHNKQTSMPPVGFEPTISAGERPQTYALDRAVTDNTPKYSHKTLHTIKPIILNEFQVSNFEQLFR